MGNKTVIANWKMCLTLKETEDLTQGILANLDEKNIQNVKTILCPPFTALKSVGEIIKKSGLSVSLGSQDVFWQEKGAYTGEISPLMLKELGVKYVLIGHSERRINLEETDEMVNRKIKLALSHDLIPILCVGETIEERKNGQTETVIKKQLSSDLENITIDNNQKLIIAYEPVWAIGSGQTVKAEEAEKIAELIRNNLKNINNLMVIYGGSVDDSTVQPFIQKSIDGFLIGGASLEVAKFLKIIQVINS